jgi:hypothetical protein
MKLSCPLTVFWIPVLLVGLFAPWQVESAPTSVPDDLEALRHAALDDIFVLREFRAGKNSFVESPERHAGTWTAKGFRYTLADLKGSGSIRHIWTTRGEGEPYFDWEFFIDGEAVPHVRGTDVDLVDAASRYPLPLAPVNAVPLGNRDFNLFLPIPFSQSCRIDVVQRQPAFWLWFCQIDYRLEDRSLNGMQVSTHGEPGDLNFTVVGQPHQRRQAAASTLPMELLPLPTTQLAPGEEQTVLRVDDPGIVRELRLRWPQQSGVRLRVAYDAATTYAVDSPADAFFGPFRGVSFYRHNADEASCYLPMPFGKDLRLNLVNEGEQPVIVGGALHVERVPAMARDWGYFHARHQRTERTDGHRLHQVLYVRGRGHWLGMTLYRTGHDHGGGDFAVIDGEGERPAFLHGVNGEDYFTFAWFGRGAHHPYAVAHSNDEGRYRHHFENVYPFKTSFALEWGAFADLAPESVAVWYQESPADTTVPDGARAESVEWDVFGPVPIPLDDQGQWVGNPYAVLPSVAALDAGQTFECQLVKERFTSGWMQEWSVGPMLNLTYVARHGTKIDYEAELGGNGHALLARRFLEWPQAEVVPFLFAHDDPIELWVNGGLVYQGGTHFNGFESNTVNLPLRQGRNEIVVRLTNKFGRNFNWAGFLLRPQSTD